VTSKNLTADPTPVYEDVIREVAGELPSATARVRARESKIGDPRHDSHPLQIAFGDGAENDRLSGIGQVEDDQLVRALAEIARDAEAQRLGRAWTGGFLVERQVAQHAHRFAGV